MRLTARDLVRQLKRLPLDRQYSYTDEDSPKIIVIKRVDAPDGPIIFRRFNPEAKPNGREKRSFAEADDTRIGVDMLERLAAVVRPDFPIDVDRIFGASYNTRSVLEALLAHTPQFYMCRPGRIHPITNKIVSGHKCLLYSPGDPHELGEVVWKNVDRTIHEQSLEFQSDSVVPASLGRPDIGDEELRRHAQIQVFLVQIGEAFGYQSWIARNDHGIKFQGHSILQYASVVSDLSKSHQLTAHPKAVDRADLIDCIWLSDNRKIPIPAVFEVEHSTGVDSGLSRMKKFYDEVPAYRGMHFVIVAPDDLRDKVVRLANEEMYTDLDVRFLSYSAVEEMMYLVQRRNLQPSAITSGFLECFSDVCRDDSVG